MRSTARLLRNRNLTLLLAGRLVSTSGDWLYTVALSVAIYRYSGGNNLSVGLLWIVRLFPVLAFSAYAGGLAGRIGYRRAMMLADVVRLVLVVVLALTLRQATWPIIYPIAFLVTAFSSLFAPASVGIIPSIVDSRDDLLPANALIMQAQSIAIVLGSAAGGVAAGSISITLLLLIQAATYGVSAITLLFLRLVARPVPQADVVSSDVAEAVADEPGGVRHTLRLIRGRPVLLFALAVMALPEFASGAFLIWIVPYSEHSLHLGNQGIGYLYAALGAGKVIGGGIAGSVGSGVRLDVMLTISVAAGGLGLAIFGLWPAAVAALLIAAVIGGAEIIEYASQETLLQRSVPEAIIGQASGTMDAFFFNMGLLGNATSGLIAAAVGLRPAMTGLGVVVMGATGVSWWYFQRQTADLPDASALARVAPFAQLSEAMREWIVERMERERYAAGTVIVRQGDEADRFYVVGKGALRVEVVTGNEIVTRELGPGDVFGEIALIERVPRTATVTATQPVTLYELSRDDFEDLRGRADTFGDSVLDLANARLQRDTGIRLSLASGA